MQLGIICVLTLMSAVATYAMSQAAGAQGAMVYVSLFIGLCVGSFLNVVAYRWPKAEGELYKQSAQRELGLATDDTVNLLTPFKAVTVGRSHCPKCSKVLGGKELIPVLSWIGLRGKCSGCEEPIPTRYPAVELFTGVATAAVYAVLGRSVEGALAVGALWTGVAAALIDWDHLYLPPFFTQGFVLAVSVSTLMNPNYPELTSAIIGGLVSYFVIGRLLPFLFYAVTRREGLGQGDAILFGMLGVVYGMEQLPTALLLSCFCAFLTYLVHKVRQVYKGELESTAFAFGPALIIVTVIGMLIRL